MAQAQLVRCPQCGSQSRFSPDNRFRPFCSERCKMIDMGAWASGEYRIPAVENDEAEPNDETDARARPE